MCACAYIYMYVYTNFECLFIECQIWYKNQWDISLEHFESYESSMDCYKQKVQKSIY